MKTNTEALLEGSREKSDYMIAYRHQNAGQNHCLLIANKSFEECGKVHEYVNNNNKSKQCNHSVQSLLSSCPLFKHLKIKKTHTQTQ
jgi:hypothetical protein